MKFYTRIVTVGNPDGYSGVVALPLGLDSYGTVEDATESFAEHDVGLILIYPGEYELSRNISFSSSLDVRGLGEDYTGVVLTRPGGIVDRNRIRVLDDADTVFENFSIMTNNTLGDNAVVLYSGDNSQLRFHRMHVIGGLSNAGVFGTNAIAETEPRSFVVTHSHLNRRGRTFHAWSAGGFVLDHWAIENSIVSPSLFVDNPSGDWDSLDYVTENAPGYGPAYGEPLIDLSVLWQHNVIGRAIDTRLQPPDRAVLFAWDNPNQFQRIPIEPTGDWSLSLLSNPPLGVYYLSHDGRVAPTVHGPYVFESEPTP